MNRQEVDTDRVEGERGSLTGDSTLLPAEGAASSPEKRIIAHKPRIVNTSRRILLVESQPGNRTFVSLLLDKIGSKLKFQLVAVDNTIDAIEWLFTQPDAFDVILFSLKLPDSSGVEFCRAIRTLPKAQNIPLAALVADRQATVAVMETLRTAGLNGCFNPFASTAEMRSLLRQWLEQSPSHKKAKSVTSITTDNYKE